jgi:hypothetical protein
MDRLARILESTAHIEGLAVLAIVVVVIAPLIFMVLEDLG